MTLRWGFASLVLIASYALLAALQWPLSPKFIDIYYHLAVMKGFAAAGGYTAHAFWENAPLGRPHLYPPLFHLLLLALYKTGLGEITLARLTEIALYPLTLLVFHRTVRNASGERAAFFALLIFSSVYSLFLSTVTLAAFSLALLFALWAYDLVRRERPVQAGLAGALVFYAHTGMAACLMLGWLVYARLSAEKRRTLLRAGLIAFFVSLPMTVLQAAHAGQFHWAKTRELFRADIDLSVLALAFAATVLLRERGRDTHAPLAFFLGALPLAVFSPYRFVSGHGLIGAVWLAAVALDSVWGKWRQKAAGLPSAAVVLLGLTAYFQLFAPVLRVDAEHGRLKTSFFDRTFMHLMFPGHAGESRDNERTIYFPEYVDPIVDAVKNFSEKDDIVWSNWNYAGGLVAMLAGRSTSTAMLAEVSPLSPDDPMRDARIHIWFKDPAEPVSADIKKAQDRYGLRLLFENEFAFVFENPRAGAKRR